MAVAAGALRRPGAGFPALGAAATAALAIGHAGALVYSERSRSPFLATAVVVLTVPLVIVQTVGRPGAGPAWIHGHTGEPVLPPPSSRAPEHLEDWAGDGDASRFHPTQAGGGGRC